MIIALYNICMPRGLKFIFLLLTVGWIIFWFLFNPHYIELGNVINTWFMSKGLIYYQEFPSFHFPIGRIALLIVYILSDFDLRYGPVLALMLGLLTSYTIYCFSIKHFSNTAAFISLSLFALLYWVGTSHIEYTHEAFIGAGLALVLYYFFSLLTTNKFHPITMFIVGLLISITELGGQITSLTLTVVVFSLIYFSIKKHTASYAKTLIESLCCGLILPFALIFVYFGYKNALSDFFYYNIAPYFYYLNSTQKDFWSLPGYQLLVYYIPLICIACIIAQRLIAHQSAKLTEILLLILGLSTIPFIVFGIYHPHHLLYALPLMSIMAGYAWDLAQRDKYTTYTVAFLLSILLIIFKLDMYPTFKQRIIFPPNFNIVNDTYPGDGMYEAIQWMRANSSSNARIMVVGDPLFYLKSDHLPSSRSSEGIPHNWQPFDNIKDEIAYSPPDYWIIADELTSRIAKDFDRPEIIEFLDQQITTCYKLQVKYKTWAIWERICS